MSPKRPPSDAMTLHELGVAEMDCGLDPDDLLEGPPVDEADQISDFEAVEDEELQVINDELHISLT